MSSLFVIPLAPLLGPSRSAAETIGITEVSGSSTLTLFPTAPYRWCPSSPAADDRPVERDRSPLRRQDPPGLGALSPELDALTGEVQAPRRLGRFGPRPARQRRRCRACDQLQRPRSVSGAVENAGDDLPRAPLCRRRTARDGQLDRHARPALRDDGARVGAAPGGLDDGSGRGRVRLGLEPPHVARA